MADDRSEAAAPLAHGGWSVEAHPHGLAVVFDFPGEPKLLGVPFTPDEADRLATALSIKAALVRMEGAPHA